MVRGIVLVCFILNMFISCQGQSNTDKIKSCEDNKIQNVIVSATSADTLFFKSLVEEFNAKEKALDNYIIEVAKLFLETPYVASTLEKDGDEHLVINLRNVDCTTFVEYVLAASVCISNKKTEFVDFVNQLATFRYRDGIIDGYPSRLHYFSNWLHDNEHKGLVDIISDQIGDSALNVAVNFMSTHPKSYKQLGNEAYLEEIKSIEKQIATYKMKYVSGSNIESVANQIKNGDVIALVTSIEGLDISHVGFAIHQNGRLHFIHASSSAMKVVISDVPLSEYISHSKKNMGIVVARLKMNVPFCK